MELTKAPSFSLNQSRTEGVIGSPSHQRCVRPSRTLLSQPLAKQEIVSQVEYRVGLYRHGMSWLDLWLSLKLRTESVCTDMVWRGTIESWS